MEHIRSDIKTYGLTRESSWQSTTLSSSWWSQARGWQKEKLDYVKNSVKKSGSGVRRSIQCFAGLEKRTGSAEKA
jgi:hypothetical protein